jgi:hypothetical protein
LALERRAKLKSTHGYDKNAHRASSPDRCSAKIFREFRQCRESESVAICWVWLNYEIDAAALYPMSTVSAQAAIMVLIQLALYALIGVPRS